MAMTLTSDAFVQGGDIPKEYNCDGANRSPPLAWSGVPEEARSLLLACDDPDAPGGVFHHWAAFDIPPDRTMLPPGIGPESLAGGIAMAVNDFGKPGYGGSCPPKGASPHRYHFRLSALSETSLPVASSATCLEVITIARPHVIEFVELIGHYGR